jgi:hypothetical protein
MLTIASSFLILMVCFGIESLAKKRWLKIALHFTFVIIVGIIVLNLALQGGASIQRSEDASMVADTLEYFEDSTQTNSLSELRAKLSVIRREIPKAIVSGEPTTPTLLSVLSVDVSTNALSAKPTH